ncbi:MAG: NUDIX hydrolase [Tildeniella nuda ZEHNDER 1965/U140]|jgi:8-oxo-dGTP pyrophosphatase MutT (NUDIX family)|nr:NUDIX hydrolase [Tildeniella nuda ZEHNDER 1965/U140]
MIRAIALGLIQNRSRLFVSEGFDPVKQDSFYRALGGGIEFGETSLEALKREFREELQAELTNICYLGCLENLFTFNGKPGHELVQLYSCDFVDPLFYQHEQIDFIDSGESYVASWIERDRFQSGELRLVPAECLQYLE